MSPATDRPGPRPSEPHPAEPHSFEPGPSEPDDLVEALLGIDPAGPLGALRRRRPEILRHAQGAYRELVSPAEPGGLPPAERAALALRAALGEGHAALAGHFRALLAARGTAEQRAAAERFPAPGDEGRLGTLLRHADLVAKHPGRVGQAEIDRLAALGLSPQDIVAATQLVSFVPFQTRLLAGLRLLRDEAPDAGPAAAEAEAAAVSARAFTMAEVGWEPRVPPVDADTATPAQRAALDACPPAQRRSTYFLTLANDPGSLGERGALFNSVMYAPRGLPRSERELATAVVSMVNGCVYCASVHARRFAELTKEPAVMQRLLDEGLGAPLDARRRAIAGFSAALTRDPGAAGPGALAPLRASGLDDLEVLDLVHSVAMFANANRLMQSLGRSVVPAGR